MKLIRRILTLALAVLMVLSLGTTAFAAEQTYTSTDKISLIPQTGIGTGADTRESGQAGDYITVSKVFSGITQDEIPNEFRLTVDGDGTANDHQLSVGGQYMLPDHVHDGLNHTYTWRVPVSISGSSAQFTIDETGFELAPKYTCKRSAAVDINAYTETVGLNAFEKLESCSDGNVKTRPLQGDTGWVVIIETNAGYNIVISEIDLPTKAKNTIRDFCGKKGNEREYPAGVDPNDKLKHDNRPCYFYNISQFVDNKCTVHGDVVVTFDPDSRQINADTNTWQLGYQMGYDYSEAIEPSATITNTYERANTNLTVKKIWNDDNYTNRPTDLQVQLWQRSSKYPDVKDVAYGEPVTIDPTVENWQHTFSDLPLTNDAGDAVTYYVTELNVPDHYTPSIGEIGKDEDGNDTITITNTIDFAGVIIEKQVTGNMGDVNKEFNFTVNSTLPIGSVGAGGTLSEDHLTATFVLKDDGTIKLSGIPDGAVLTIKETNADGYTMKIDGGTYVPGTGYEYTVETDGNDLTEFKIVVTNEKEVLVDTGIFLDSLPYVLILGVVVVGFLFLRKRRHDDD